MPPKRAIKAATGPRRSTRNTHAPELFSNSEDSITVKAPAGKRKAADEVAQPLSKRTTKATPASRPGRKPAAKRIGRLAVTQPESKSRTAGKASPGRGRPRKNPVPPAVATKISSARGHGATAKAAAPPATSTGRGRGRPKKTEAAAASTPSTSSARAKKTPTSRKAPTPAKKATTTTTNTATSRGRPKKRPAEEEEEQEKKKDVEAPQAKKPRVGKAKPPKEQPAKPTKVPLPLPTEKLSVFLAGAGDGGELGLGVGKTAVNVKRPRLNAHLDDAGVVQIAVGGMHCAALTHDNKILTWGVNDQGALGRNTAWEGGMRDMDADGSDSDSEEEGGDLNPHEAVPTAIDSKNFPLGTRFVQLIAGDNSTFVLTEMGQVYGWGTFRDNQGLLGFSGDGDEQRTPVLIKGLENIVNLACGSNFALALDAFGAIFSWGAGQQHQLGREVPHDERFDALRPRQVFSKSDLTALYAGSDHSFAVTASGQVYAWGMNNWAQCGISAAAGQAEASISTPTLVTQLATHKISMLAGGNHHTLAVTTDGKCLSWGHVDKAQVGIDVATLPEADIARSEATKKVALLRKPTLIPSLPQGKVVFVAAGSDHSIAVTKDGKAYSWGFSGTYQTGQGTDDDVTLPTLLDNTAIRKIHVKWAGGGGQSSAFGGSACEEELAQAGVVVNGTNGLGARGAASHLAPGAAPNGIPPVNGFVRGADALNDVSAVSEQVATPAVLTAATNVMEDSDIVMGEGDTELAGVVGDMGVAAPL